MKPGRLPRGVAFLIWAALSMGTPSFAATWAAPEIPGVAPGAVVLGRDLDGDGDPDEVDISLEVIEVEEEVYPGEFVTFWVFAPEARGMVSAARAPSPTLRVEEGDRVRITLHNTHYLAHTIHLHGTVGPNPVDTRPLRRVEPGQAFTYEFIATDPGTHFYHCHVLPDVHPRMGLVGMLIIEPNRPENVFTHLIPGAGRIEDLSKAAMARFQREYSLVYMDIDDQLNRIPATSTDPREIEMRMHAEYDPSKRQPNILVLNGRSFPFTLRDTPIEVTPGERARLRILNGGARTINLHTHGHRPTANLYVEDFEPPVESPATENVLAVAANQRIDLEIVPGSDGFHASGPGVWTLHDHPGKAITDQGLAPGGDTATIVYDGFMGADGLPRVPAGLARFFERESHATEPARGAVLDTHRIVAKSCEAPRGFRRIHMRAGTKFAGEGEAFAFEPRIIRADPCEEVEIVLENTDAVRHAFMLPGLNPMFTLEFTGPGTEAARFVTPDQDIALEFHCHVETHEKMGMHGTLIVGKGGEHKAHGEPPAAAKRVHQGVGIVIAVEPRKSRLVVDHEEIKDFMAPMVMSFVVKPAALLQGLEPGDKVRFTIDADRRAIIDVVPVDE